MNAMTHNRNLNFANTIGSKGPTMIREKSDSGIPSDGKIEGRRRTRIYGEAVGHLTEYRMLCYEFSVGH